MNPLIIPTAKELVALKAAREAEKNKEAINKFMPIFNSCLERAVANLLDPQNKSNYGLGDSSIEYSIIEKVKKSSFIPFSDNELFKELISKSYIVVIYYDCDDGFASLYVHVGTDGHYNISTRYTIAKF